MAISVHSNTVVFQEEAHSGFTETLQQETDAFNAASNGAIVLARNLHEGYYNQEAFFKLMAGLVTRRDITAPPATPVTDIALTEDQQIKVKLFRKIGPVAYTRGMFRTMMEDPSLGSIIVGRQMAKATVVDMLNSALRATVAALSGVASLLHNVTAASPADTVSTDNLIQTLFKAGDSSGDIVLWVMHSVAYAKLVRDQASTYSFDSVAGVNIATGTPVTLGRPVLLTDAAPLYGGASPIDPVKVLGLRRGAITIDESELQDVVTDDITGGEQLAVRVQGEIAYTLGVLGFKYDVTSGQANPTDSAVGTAANWDQVMTSHKSLAGVMMIADPQ